MLQPSIDDRRHSYATYAPLEMMDGIGFKSWEELSDPNRTPTANYRQVMWTVVTGCLLLTTLLMGGLFIVQDHDVARAPADCGNNPAEARELGCVFDLITFCWARPECSDPELTAEFLAVHPWRWYTEKDGNHTVSEEVAMAGERELFVTWKYHKTHCIYMYKKLHRAMLLRSGWVDSHLGDYNHTEHCDIVLSINGVDMDEVSTRATPIFTSCDELS